VKSFLYLLIIAALINSCSNGKKEKEIPAGGPCSYDEKIYPAKLVKLDASADSSIFNGWFEIDNTSGNGKEIISYLRLTNRSITKDQRQKDSMAVGNVYKYVVRTIKSGSCNPKTETIWLEKY
jgi:hypothetical protein